MGSWQSYLTNSCLWVIKTTFEDHLANRPLDTISGLRERVVQVTRMMALANGAGPRSSQKINHGPVPGDWFKNHRSLVDHVILYLHGGIFCLPALPLHHQMLERLGNLLRFQVFMPDYRLAPEDPFPAGLNDCVSAYQWLLELGYEPGSIVIAGDSAGGNLTLASLAKIRELNLPMPACAVALSPGADLTASSNAHIRNAASDALLSMNYLRVFLDAYVGDHPHDTSLISPLFMDFSGLPPLLLHAGDLEILADDALRVAQQARSSNVIVELDIWENMQHVFQLLHRLPESHHALEKICRFILRHTRREYLSCAKAAGF
jgi:acetyl esterase/lipase